LFSIAIILAVPAIAAGAASPAYSRWVESTLGALASLIVAGCTLAFFWILSGICFALFDTIGIIDFDWRGFWHFVLICASCVVFAGGVLLARREASRVSVLFSFFARLGGMLLEAVLAGEAAPERIPVDIIAVDKQPRFLRGNAR
jgi:ABC-type multidrug transport system permease subunit